MALSGATDDDARPDDPFLGMLNARERAARLQRPRVATRPRLADRGPHDRSGRARANRRHVDRRPADRTLPDAAARHTARELTPSARQSPARVGLRRSLSPLAVPPRRAGPCARPAPRPVPPRPGPVHRRDSASPTRGDRPAAKRSTHGLPAARTPASCAAAAPASSGFLVRLGHPDPNRDLGTQHLQAALALWQYTARSAAWALDQR